MIKIAIADKNRLFSSAISDYFKREGEFKVMFVSDSSSDLKYSLSQTKADILLISLNICENKKNDCLKKIIQSNKKLKIIVLSSQYNKDLILNSIDLGVHAFITKSVNLEELQVAIRTVVNNGYHYSEHVAKALHQKYLQLTQFNPVLSKTGINFTPQEVSIIKLTCKEKTNKVIALELSLSERTVESYRKKIMDKVGCKNVVGLALFAVKYDMI